MMDRSITVVGWNIQTPGALRAADGFRVGEPPIIQTPDVDERKWWARGMKSRTWRVTLMVAASSLILVGCGTGTDTGPLQTPSHAHMSTATGTERHASGSVSPKSTVGHIVGTVQAHVRPSGGWNLTGIDFQTVQHGYAVAQRCVPGTEDCTGAIGATSDGGTNFSWSVLGQGAPQSVQFTGPQHGWVLLGREGQTQRLVGTTDGGRTWSVLERGQVFVGAPHFLSDTLGYGIGPGQGTRILMGPTELLRTTDGGRTWQGVGTGGYYPAYVDFIDPHHGYLAGWRCTTGGGPFGSCQGAILATADGGRRWHVLQEIGTTNTANVGTFALDFLSPTVGFAELPNLAGNTMGGGLSALEETRDGGRTWYPLQPNYQWGTGIRAGWPSAPQFATGQVGWIALSPGAGGGAGGVLITTDGGHTFHQFGAADYVAGTLDALDGIAYAVVTPMAPNGPASALVAIGTNGTVQQLYPRPTPTVGLPPQGSHALFGWGLPSNPSALLVSQDAGQHWRVVGNLPGQIPDLLSFANPQQGYAVSNLSNGGVQGYRTSDGGRSWRAVGPPLRQAPFYVRLFAHGQIVAVPDGTVMRSGNGGRSWIPLGRLPKGLMWAVSFATPQRGVAYLGEGGSVALYATNDGGRHWHILMRLPVTGRGQTPGQRMALDASGFGIVQRYGWSGQYLVTHNGGHTWRTLDLPQAANAQSLTVSGPDLAMIVTTTGLYRSRDGGRTWESIPSSFNPKVHPAAP